MELAPQFIQSICTMNSLESTLKRSLPPYMYTFLLQRHSALTHSLINSHYLYSPSICIDDMLF